METNLFKSQKFESIISFNQEDPLKDDVNIYKNFSLKQFLQFIGPGFLVSIAYLDPGNFQGDIDVSNSSKYSLLWVLLMSTYFGFLYQSLAQKLGTITGTDLANLIRKHYDFKLSMILWFMAEIAIIGADIQEIIGSAIALNILFGLQIWIGVLITLLDTFGILLIQYYRFNKIEQIFGLCLLIMTVCFFISLTKSNPDLSELFSGIFIPSIPQGSLNSMIGLIGCIIMPHNLYLHSTLVLSRKINRNSNQKIQRAIQYFNLESFLALFISFIINTCIISTFANYQGNSLIKGGQEINLLNAGDILGQSFKYGKYIWGIGLLAAGQSSTLAGTMAGQFVMEGFIKIKISRTQRSILTRSVAIIPSMIVALMGTSEKLNSALNILQAIQLPFAVIPLMKFSRNKQLLGDFTIGNKMYFILSFVATMMILLNIYSIGNDIQWRANNPIAYFYVIILFAYFSLIFVILRYDLNKKNIYQSEISISTQEEKQFIQKVIKEDDDYSTHTR